MNQKQYIRGTVRPWEDVLAELEKRHGIKISNTRVQQIAQRAEQKIAAEIEKLFPNHEIENDEPKQSRRLREADIVV